MRRLVPLFLLAVTAGSAHIGSPDVFFEGNAGPYRLLVTIRPPVVIPGVAAIEVRSTSPDVRELHIVPLPLTGPGATFAPTPDLAERSQEDPQFFTGSLWIMAFGSWQIRIEAQGALGKGQVSVPVPAIASRAASMKNTMAALLLILMVLLVVGLISIVGAGVREGQLEPGKAPTTALRRRAWIVMAVTTVVVLSIVYLGKKWWDAEAGAYSNYLYKPLRIATSLENGRLKLRLEDPGWLRFRKLNDLIPDHNHLMHMFLTRLPEMERFWHLHPKQIQAAVFEQQLPPMPAGRYQIFADIVHENGLAETVSAEISLPEIIGKPLAGDDSAGEGPPLEGADKTRAVAALAVGGRMVWEREPEPLRAGRLSFFRFRVEDASGKPAEDLELYMGMPGHAVFLKPDRTVFAHVHPSGSAPMAAVSLVNSRAAHAMHMAALPPVVSFPYGFPQAGDYRIFVQIKRASRIETGVFDARVE